MRANRILAALVSMLILLAVRRPRDSSAQSGNSSSSISPPVAPVRPVTDEYFGTKVVDPYRYMENLKDPEVKLGLRRRTTTHALRLRRFPGGSGSSTASSSSINPLHIGLPIYRGTKAGDTTTGRFCRTKRWASFTSATT
jgi:prolyl oligopeptidase